MLIALLLPAAAKSQTADRRAEATCPVHEVEAGAKALAVALDTCIKRYNWTPEEVDHVKRMTVITTRMIGYTINLRKGGIDAVAVSQILNIFSPAEQDIIGNASKANSPKMHILLQKIIAEVKHLGIKQEYVLDACDLVVMSADLNREYGLFVKEHH